MKAAPTLVLAFVSAFAAAAERAQAATVSALTSSPSVTFKAARGERNDVAITVSGDTYTVRDAGAPLTAGGLCRQVDSNTAECRAKVPFDVILGDRNDRLRPTVASGALALGLMPSITVDGGTGNDRIDGGPYNDTLDGGEGADVLDGGPGTDVVDYSRRTRGVVVRLGSRGPQGGRGEGDRIRRVEGIIGSDGPDLLVGDGRANSLKGGYGSDVLRGGGGNDVLEDVGESRPVSQGVLDGGDGDDRISVVPGSGPGNGFRVRCGGGDDLVTIHPTLRDLFSGCENLGDTPLLPTVLRSGVVRYDWPCWGPFASGVDFTCSGSIALRDARGRLLGRGRTTHTFPRADFPGGVIHTRLHLTRLGRKVLTSTRRHVIRVHSRFWTNERRRTTDYRYRVLTG